MKLLPLAFLLLIKGADINSLDNLITALKIKNSEEVISHFLPEGEIIINDVSSKGNKYKLTNVLEDFYFDNEIKELKIIHRGKSENNLIYILGEYISNHDIYKLLILIKIQDDNYKIEKIKLDLKR